MFVLKLILALGIIVGTSVFYVLPSAAPDFSNVVAQIDGADMATDTIVVKTWLQNWVWVIGSGLVLVLFAPNMVRACRGVNCVCKGKCENEVV